MHLLNKKFFLLFIALTAASGCGVADTTPTTSRLGINFAGVSDWTTETPFVDVFRQARVWVSNKNGGKFGGGPPLNLDEHGWVKSVEPDCVALTPFLNMEKGAYPAGVYTCLYEGEGDIKIIGATKILDTKPGRITFELSPADKFKNVTIASTNPANYIRNIRIYMPGVTEESAKQNPWNPVFLERWKSFNTFRFMDWMRTNGSKIKEWADRPKVDDATWTKTGIPLEMMIDLCNRTGVNPWFCMPHEASDDYVRQFAQQVKRDLKPHLKSYIEYSNEIWNTAFIQTKYAAEKGQEFGADPDMVAAASKYYAARSIQIFKIWEEVFGGHDRFIRVIATWSGSEKTSEIKLSFQDAYKQCDALATAPYFSPVINIVNTRNPDLVADKVSAWTPDQLLDYVEKNTLPSSIKQMEKQKAVADKYKVKLVAYEGGQHLVGLRAATQNDTLNKLFYAVNRHERMGQFYKQYLDAWRDLGGDTFCIFSSVGKWSKSGSWGLLEFNGDNTPKYQAVMKWNQDNPKP